MTLNGVMAVTLRYFSEFGKPALQRTICGGIYARVCCISSACTMSSQRKFTFAISSPDEFLVVAMSRLNAILSAHLAKKSLSTFSVKKIAVSTMQTSLWMDQKQDSHDKRKLQTFNKSGF